MLEENHMCVRECVGAIFRVSLVVFAGIIRQHLACVCVCVCDPPQTERAPYSSRVAAVLAPCLVGLAIVVMLGLALALAKLRERRQTEGGFSPRRLEAPGGRNPPAEPGNTSISTLAARVERLV